MWEFIVSYKAELVSTVAIIGALSPALIKRVVSDKNMIKVFDNIKEVALKVKSKEGEIVQTITLIDKVVEKVQNDINDNIKRIDETILEFTSSEIYTKMLLGLSQLDELNKVLQAKDTNIQDIMTEIKEIKKKL